MKAQLWPRQDGTYYADFMFDDAPPGFEDHFDDSLFARRLRRGATYVEYGRPDLTHLCTRPEQALARYTVMEERCICAYVTCEMLGTEGFRLIAKPVGPLKEAMVNDLIHKPTGYGLEMRILLANNNESDDTEPKVNQIITADFIQL